MAALVEVHDLQKHGDGSIKRYADSPNWISVYSLHGKEHRVSTKTSDKKAALAVHKRHLIARSRDLAGDAPMVTPKHGALTVAVLLDAWGKDIDLRGLKSAYKLKCHAKPLRDSLGPRRAVSITAEAVDDYIESLQKAGYKDATINRRVYCLGAALKLAAKRKLIPSAPEVRKLREDNVRRVFWEHDEVEGEHGLLWAAREVAPHLVEPIRYFYAVGWRKGEICLTWSMVDVKAGTITIPDSKNGRGRIVPIAGDLVGILKRCEQARPYTRGDGEPSISEYVFHRKGHKLGDFKRAWYKVLAHAGWKPTTVKHAATGKLRHIWPKNVHDFRRTVVRKLSRSGVRDIDSMSITGHRTRSVFDRYNIVSTQDMAAALEKSTSGKVAVSA